MSGVLFILGAKVLDEEMERLLSTPRLQLYKEVTRSPEDAWTLYVLNTELSGAYFESISWVEVAFRNALSERLQALRVKSASSGKWFEIDHPWFDPWFSKKSVENIQLARDRASSPNSNIRPGKVIAELTFGFWCTLLEPRYEASLWTPTLRQVFPKGFSREAVHTRYRFFGDLRNRVAHHEPIFLQSHHTNWKRILEALDWLSHSYQISAEATCRLPEVSERFYAQNLLVRPLRLASQHLYERSQVDYNLGVSTK